MVNNPVVARIAQKIRSIRLERKLTLQELATRTQVSKGLISKIENLRTVPSLPVFITLLHSMNISPEDFFCDAVLDKGEVRLIKRNQYINPLTSVNAGLQTQPILSQNISRCTMEVAHLILEPGFSGKVVTKKGYAFHYVLFGSCEYKIKNDLFPLEEGDAMFVDTSAEDLLINKSIKNVMILSIHFVF
jgi:transcriptional regulator with XRE-family HTH domain